MEKEIFKFRGLRIELDDTGLDTEVIIYEVKSKLPINVFNSGLAVLMNFTKKATPYFYLSTESCFYKDYDSYHISLANPYFSARYCFERLWDEEINIDIFLNKEEVSDFIKYISGCKDIDSIFDDFLNWCNSDIDTIIDNLKLIIKYINELFYNKKSFFIMDPDTEINFYDFSEYDEDDIVYKEELDLTTITIK